MKAKMWLLGLAIFNLFVAGLIVAMMWQLQSWWLIVPALLGVFIGIYGVLQSINDAYIQGNSIGQQEGMVKFYDKFLDELKKKKLKK